jgi:hypothetical protein
MRFIFALLIFSFLSPVFANQCPSPDQIRSCSGKVCSFLHVSGWSQTVFYDDQEKTLAFQKVRVQSSSPRLSCFYAYVDPVSHGYMPPAVVLRR